MSREFIIGTDVQEFVNDVTKCAVCGKELYIAKKLRTSFNYRTYNKNKKYRYACSYSCFKKMNNEIACSWKFKPEVKEK